MEYVVSGPNERDIGESRNWRTPASQVHALPSSELQFALARGAGEMKDVERRIRRIKASTERALVSSRGLVPASSPLAAEIAAAADEAEEAERQSLSARTFLENPTGRGNLSGAFSA